MIPTELTIKIIGSAECSPITVRAHLDIRASPQSFLLERCTGPTASLLQIWVVTGAWNITH